MNARPDDAPTPCTAVSGDERRILMVAACPFPALRGTPVRILRMAETLAERGHDVHVATYGFGADTPLPDSFTVHRIANPPFCRRMEPGPSVSKLTLLDPLLALRTRSLAARLRPDVLHAHHFEGLLSAVPASRRHAIPLVFDAHVLLLGELEYYRTGLPSGVRNRVAAALDRRLPRLADHIIAVSDEIRDVLVKVHGLDERAITTVANGVEPRFFEGDARHSPAATGPRLLFTGNLAAYQGAGLMLDAFARVARQIEAVELMIVTDSDSAEFRERAAALGVADRIRVLPTVLDELPGILASADVALNPRVRCPGVPQKLLNYMAAGAPIVSFAGSAKYLRDGENALVVTDNDVRAFGQAIERLVLDRELATTLGETARRFARQHLRWDVNATRVEQVYDSLLQNERGALTG